MPVDGIRLVSKVVRELELGGETRHPLARDPALVRQPLRRVARPGSVAELLVCVPCVVEDDRVGVDLPAVTRAENQARRRPRRRGGVWA